MRPRADGSLWSRWTAPHRSLASAARSHYWTRLKDAACSLPITLCGTPREVTYATFCQGPYEESRRYRDFMGWEMPWYSALGSLETLLVGRRVGTCPVRTLQAWLEQAGVAEGSVFRSLNRHGKVQLDRLAPLDVARIVKKLAQRAGLDPAKYAGHSLRARHATSAAASGASERSIMNQTGHRSVQMVRRYIREGSLFRENSAGKLGL